jgi:hypothetical protein
MAAHEIEDRTAGFGEPALIGSPAHRLTDGGCGYLRDHAGGLGRRERVAVGEDAVAGAADREISRANCPSRTPMGAR